MSWDSFLRRYNADLANDLGNLINRSVSMANRYLDGDRPFPAAGGPLGAQWPETFRGYAAHIEGCTLHEALDTLWRFVGAGNRYVDAQQPWVLAKAAKAGDAAAAASLRDVLGELLEACRVIGLAVAPFMPDFGRAHPRPARPRVPVCRRWLRWAADAGAGRVGRPRRSGRAGGAGRAHLPAPGGRAGLSQGLAAAVSSACAVPGRHPARA